MKIALQIPYYADGIRGPLIYTTTMARHLTEIGADVTAFAYFLKDHDRHRARLLGMLGPYVKLDTRRWPGRLVRTLPVVDRLFLRPGGYDVFHDMNGHSTRTPSVFTLFGAGLSVNGLCPTFERTIAPKLPHYSRVAVFCDLVRDFLLKYYPVDPVRIAFVPFGVDHSMFYPMPQVGSAALARAQQKYRLPREFILCVGPFQFRDKVEHLLALDMDMKYDIVLLPGGGGEHWPALKKKVAGRPRIHVMPPIPYREMPLFYNLATVLVHCSYFEDLGTTLRDAAACGLPIIASAGHGNEEALEGAAVYFNANILRELRAAIVRVMADPLERSRMRCHGVSVAARFTWADSARKMASVYNDAVRNP